MAALRASDRGLGAQIILLSIAGGLIGALFGMFDYAGAIEQEYAQPWGENACQLLRNECTHYCRGRLAPSSKEQAACRDGCVVNLDRYGERRACLQNDENASFPLK